jgi:hypothetical protein
MKALRRSMILAVAILAILAGVVQQASAAVCFPGKSVILLGTTGAGSSPSTLVQLDAKTGALIKTIGPVGYTVNGLAWDGTSGKLYATTVPRDKKFHGLITIDPMTGAGTPVDASVKNFGLPFDPGSPESPIHSITIDVFGNMVGWYDEFSSPGVPSGNDTFVRINKRTGIAKEFPNTGIDTSQNGLSFSEFNLLWNIDAPQLQDDGTLTQTAYILNPYNGKPFFSRPLSPPTPAALGDFNPVNNLYYGLNFVSLTTDPTFIVVVNPRKGTVTTLGETVQDLHTLTFVKGHR